MKKLKRRLPMMTALIETFGFSPWLASVVAIFILALGAAALVWLVLTAPPRTLTVTSGPPGSVFERYANDYQKLLAARGVKLKIVPSEGSLENLQRLISPQRGIDIGFVQDGVAEGIEHPNVVSLGSIAYQPLWIFYRSPRPLALISELAGKRLGVGLPGSGTHALALALLQANGITGAPTTLVETKGEEAGSDLLAGKLDAIFLMGEAAPIQTLRTLLRTPDVRLYSFVQADAYVRSTRLANLYLNKVVVPQGSFELTTNLPPQDVNLVAPAVELVARKELNSALSDLLLSVAHEVHGKATLLQRQGEFPAPREREFPISDDAQRYYKSGQSWIARMVDNFWLASLLSRLLVAIVPIALLVIPTIRLLPVVYRWSIQLRFYRCYRPLLRLQRDADRALTQEDVDQLLHRLDQIEEMVHALRVPASFAYQYYDLHGHIDYVRAKLKDAAVTT